MAESAPADRLVTLPETVPELTLGWEVVHWATKYLIQPNGPRAGQRYMPTDNQVRFLLHWYAVDPDGNWLYHRAVRRLSKGSGKSPFAAVVALAEFCGPTRLRDFDARVPGGCVGKPVPMPWVQCVATTEAQPLALDTPVPTLNGWRTVGELGVGEVVFDGDGRPVPVQHVTPIYLGEPCYRVTFDDGEQITASSDHAWTMDRASLHDRAIERVTVTTGQIADDYLSTSGQRRYRTGCPRIDLPPRDLPVEPYLLGLWLGDGTTNDASIAFDWRTVDEVVRIVEELIEPYEVIVLKRVRSNGGLLRVKRRPYLCPHGHDYSTDHYRTPEGHPSCLICIRSAYDGTPRPQPIAPTLRERLRYAGVLGNKHIPMTYLRAGTDQRLALLQGLMDSDGSINHDKGRACFTNKNRELIEGVQELLTSLGYKWFEAPTGNGAWRVLFNPKDGRPVFRLGHKAQRQRTNALQSRKRYVVNVEKVDTVPVRCVGVDTPDHLFLVGRHNTATHNTANTFRHVRALAAKGSKVVDAFSLDPGKVKYYKPPEGTLEVITSSARAAEGAESTFICADEAQYWTPNNSGPELMATLSDNLSKSASRMLTTCIAWEPGARSVAETDWDAWVAQEEGRTRGESRILYDARVAPPDTDLSDPESLRRGLEHVYGDCHWVDIRAIMERIWDPASRPDDSKRKYLNRPTASEDAWTTQDRWARLADRDRVVERGEEIALFFDGSKSLDASALVGCCLSDGHVFALGVWEPDPYDEDDVVPAGDVDRAVHQAFETFTVLGFFSDVKEWESFAKVSWPGEYGDRLLVWALPSGREPQAIAWDMRSRTQDFTMACELTLTEIEEGRFTHDGNAAMGRHVCNARRSPNRWGISIAKESRRSPRKIDACVAMIGARMVRRHVLGSKEYQKRLKRVTGKGRVVVMG